MLIMTKGASSLLATGVLACMLGACAGGNRLISNSGGEVVTGKLNLSDIPQRPELTEYVISHGDVLNVLFFYNSDLNQYELKVRPDGKITLPYLGDVPAAGKPVSVLDSVLVARYSEVLVKPDVSVVVKEYTQQVVYVLGEVPNPGGYPYKNGMTLLDFLAVGGGALKSGKKTAVVVIRRIAPDHVVGIQVDIVELLDKKRFDLNVPLQAFDILYVPKSELSKAQDFALAMRDIFTSPMDIYIKGWYVANIELIYDFYRRQAITPVP